MSINQDFEWFRCTNGYEIIDWEFDDEVPRIDISPLSHDTETIFPFAKKGADLLLQFASIQDEEDILFFVDEFGPLESEGRTKPLSCTENGTLNFINNAAQVHTVLSQYTTSMALPDGAERDDLHEQIKKQIDTQLTFNWSEGTPEMTFVDGKPILRRPPSDLKSAIWLGLIQFMQLQIICLQCAWCKIWFRPKRRKKSNAKHSFCSKNCRTQFSNREIAKTKRKEKR